MSDQANLPPAQPMRDLIAARLSRRTLLAGAMAAPLLPAIADAAPLAAHPLPAFASLPATNADKVTVPEEYVARTLLAWGDALFEGMPAFDPDKLTRADQERRVGQNCDMLALFPAEWAFPWPKDQSRHLLCINNEYADPNLMFPSHTSQWRYSAEQQAAILAATGVTITQVERQSDGSWTHVREAAPGGRNRRITPFSPMVFEGPARAHPWIVEASAAFNAAEPGGPAGSVPCGTTANCAGGQTPWGTYLTCEENFNFPFYISDPNAAPLVAKRENPAFLIDAANYSYPIFEGFPRPGAPPQFDTSKNPHGATLYGWTVEIDPYDPNWTPRKRTALGRRKPECATTALARDGRVVVYSGDDQIDEFLYKFVSTSRFNPANRVANRDLLNAGRLYVARLEEDGTGRWIPLTLAAANVAARAQGSPRFTSEADVLVRAREVARLLGATPMDRPEDFETIKDDRWVGSGHVFVTCTNNSQQGFAHPGNPRREDPDHPDRAQSNRAGHILRLLEQGGDCGALRFTWEVFLLGGDPAAETATIVTNAGIRAHVSTKVDGKPTFTGARFACPDNICFDSHNNLWIATDGSDAVFGDCNDAVLVTSAAGTGPRELKRFLVGPLGCEICGPMMSFDEKTFFCAVQHPGETDASGVHVSELRWNKGQKPPSTFPDGGWPRAAVVYVTRADGGKIG